MNRRKFIKNLSAGVGGTSLALGGVPISLMSGNHHFQALAATSNTDRVLVVLQLHGGNDGLNTVIPVDQYALYYNRRANIAIPDFGSRKYIDLDSTLDVQNQVGLHPDMIGLKELYDRGEVSLVQGISYPNNNGSHFRGRDIYHMGGGFNDYFGSGWVGRYLDQVFPNYPDAYPNADMPDPLALELGNDVSLIFHRDDNIPVSVSIQNPDQFFELVDELQGFQDLQNIDPRGIPPTTLTNTFYGKEMDYLLSIEQKSDEYAERLKVVFDAGSNSANVTYPEIYPLNAPAGSLRNPISRQLKLVARLLSGGCKTKVFLVRIGGFDTHAEQVESYDPTLGVHAAKMYHIAAAMKAFQDDLKGLGLHDRVLTFTTSEFGRRIDSNASYGTDHGVAQPWFLIGKYAMPGVIGQNSDLSLPGGNLPMQYDYRQVLTSILKDWFQASDDVIVNTKFGDFINDTLPVIATQPVTSVDKFINDRFRLNDCYPNPAKDSVTFSFYINTAADVTLVLKDSQGKKLKIIFSGKKGIGLHEIKTNLADLPSGTYFYSIKAGQLEDTKKLMIVK